MNKTLNILIFFSLFLYSIFINYYTGNTGVIPPDSFTHFDGAYLIKKNIYPIKDYWVHIGYIPTYIQSLFFSIFGESWNAYVLHASTINAITALSCYYFFRIFKLKKIYSFFYSFCVATLCYPTMGTPLPYFHGYIFSLLTCLILCVIYFKEDKWAIFVLPILMCVSFLSSQVPATYINIITIFFILLFFYRKKNSSHILIFFSGSLLSLIAFYSLLKLTETPIYDFIYQYILFPLSIGGSRVLSDPNLNVGSINFITFDQVIFDYKFFYIFLFPLIYFTFIKIKKNNIFNVENFFLVNVIIILSIFAFIFHQLITVNQIYIYSLIPVIAAVLHINLDKNNIKKKYFITLVILTLLISFKYHYRNNIERRFLDFQWTNLNQFVKGDLINKKFHNLKWITPKYWGLSLDSNEEVKLIKEILKTLKNDKRNKAIVTNFQLFALAADEKIINLNIAYLFNNSTHPMPGSKYYYYYSTFVKKVLKNHNIEVVYNVEFEKNNFLSLFDPNCIKEEKIFKNNFSSFEIIDCK